jgi:hypothetical protein
MHFPRENFRVPYLDDIAEWNFWMNLTFLINHSGQYNTCMNFRLKWKWTFFEPQPGYPCKNNVGVRKPVFISF